MSTKYQLLAIGSALSGTGIQGMLDESDGIHALCLEPVDHQTYIPLLFQIPLHSEQLNYQGAVLLPKA